jgi:hypothetical protein
MMAEEAETSVEAAHGDGLPFPSRKSDLPSSELDSPKRGPPSLDAATDPVLTSPLSRSTSHAPMKGRDRDDGAAFERRRVV